MSSPTARAKGPAAARSTSSVPEPHPRLRKRSVSECPGSAIMAWATVAFSASGRLQTRHGLAERGMGVRRRRASQPPPDTERRIDRSRWASSVRSSRRMAEAISSRSRLMAVDSAPAALTRKVLKASAGWRARTVLTAAMRRVKCWWPRRALGRGTSKRSTRWTATAVRRPMSRSAGPAYLKDARPSFGYPVSR